MSDYDLTLTQKYQRALSTLVFSPYKWGGDNEKGTDCSGSVCYALNKTFDINVRFTAEDLYKNFFTEQNPKKDTIKAVFWFCKKDTDLGQKTYKAGQCAHVTGVCGSDVVLNCVDKGCYLRSVTSMALYYCSIGFDYKVMGLNIKALKKYLNTQ